MTDPDWLSILLLWFFCVCVCVCVIFHQGIVGENEGCVNEI